MNFRPFFPLILFVSVSAADCGGTSASLGKPWNEEDIPFFDDGADLIENPIALFGSWGDRQKNGLEGRIQLADIVALVEIQAVRTDTNMEKKEVKQINVNLVENLYGAPPSKKLSLKSLSSAPGYELILRYERHLTGNFILFYRRFETEDETGKKTFGHHFHLSPASPQLTEHVRDRLAFRVHEESN